MKNVVPSKATGLLALGLLITSASIPHPAGAMLTQRAGTNTAPSADPGSRSKEAGRSAKAPVLARNTSPASPDKGQIAAKKNQRPEVKSTIGRCWKRLMDNIREVRHAHHKK